MADAIISAVVGDMVSRLISLLGAQFTGRQSIESKRLRVGHLLVNIESVVEEAEGRQIANHGLLRRLSELVDGMYQGRYFLDTFRSRALELQQRQDHDDGNVPRSYSLSSFNPAKRMRVAVSTAKRLVLRDDGDGELDGVLANLESISSNLLEFIVLLQSCRPALYQPLTTNIYVNSQMFGRRVERQRIISFLMQGDDPSSAAEPAVLPVIGHAGAGKTTLVQHVRYDPMVRNRFSLIVLLDFLDFFLIGPYAYGQFARGEIERALISAVVTARDMGDHDEPLRLLKRKLRGKGFLIVFENVNLDEKRLLDALLPSLTCGRRGSKIIVTSTDKQLASIGTVDAIHLKPLPHEESWFFFKAHAFGGADVEADARLVVTGREIARELKGSFFGAQFVGGLLRARPDHRLWREVLKLGIADLTELSWIERVVLQFRVGCIPSDLQIGCVTSFFVNMKYCSKKSA